VQFAARYRQAVPIGADAEPLSLGSIVDDVLGLRWDEPYFAHLARKYYRPFERDLRDVDDHVPDEIVDATRRALDEAGDGADPRTFAILIGRLDEFLAAGAPDLEHQQFENARARALHGDARPYWRRRRDHFEGAVFAAAEGKPSAVVGEHLTRIRVLPGGAVDIPADLYALASWSLAELLRGGPVRVSICPSCDRPWLPDRDATHCRRPAPGRFASCRDVAKQARFVEAHPEFHRERKKLAERVRRGTLDRGEFGLWASENEPDKWIPFDEWKAAQIRRNETTTTGRRRK
jgi:hypothetical protein